MVKLTIDPALRTLLEAIEAWPSAVSQAQTAALKSRRAGNLPVLPLGADRRGGASAGGPAGAGAAAGSSRRSNRHGQAEAEADAGHHMDAEQLEDEHDREILRQEEEEERLEALEAQEKAAARNSPRNPSTVRLSSSLRAPHGGARLSSMASGVPQRDDSTRRSVLGPELGPGVYPTTVQAMATHDPQRASVVFRSKAPQRPKGFGNVGEAPAPDSMYANLASPVKPYPKVHGGNEFISTTCRFGTAAHFESVLLQQQPVARRRPTPYWQGAPVWEAPFANQPKLPGVQFPPPADHRERLAAARASLQQPEQAEGE